MSEKLYGMVCGIPDQMKLISNYCFGECGKVCVGAGYDNQLGEVALCRENECPALDKQMEEPIGEINGEKLYLRKLCYSNKKHKHKG